MNRMFGSDQSSDGSAANRRSGSKLASGVRSKKPASGSASETTSRRPLAGQVDQPDAGQVAARGQGGDGLQRAEARPRGARAVRLRDEVPGAEVPLVVPGAAGAGQDAGQALAVQVGPLVPAAVQPFREVGLAVRVEGEHLLPDQRLAVLELGRRHRRDGQAAVPPVGGLGDRDQERIARVAGVGRSLLVGVSQVERPDQAVSARRELAGEVVEEQEPLDPPVGADLEARAVGGERIGPHRPGAVSPPAPAASSRDRRSRARPGTSSRRGTRPAWRPSSQGSTARRSRT